MRRYFGHCGKSFESIAIGCLAQKALRIIEAHPEYQTYLEHIEDYLDKNWTPEQGETNPFLHLSLHLSIQEQVGIDQPFGIRAIHQKLVGMHNDNWMKAEDEMMEALVETIWQAQRHNQGLDVNAYMTRLRKLVGLGQEDERRINPHEVVQLNKNQD